ncbi:MAG: type II 3-dehydroquinate dehydratase [Rhodobacteraceae bacterium]|nr:type II 3-dehydroquinate dehydratase [Paracoccaceae bacterium]
MASLLILNGPNLNRLGTRQPEIYGAATLAEIERMCIDHGQAQGYEIACYQSNCEGALIEAIHAAFARHSGIVLNAAAYTHSSIALMDAVAAVAVPTVEVHLSNVHARESFRHKSYLSRVALGQICGFGPLVYRLAIDALVHHLAKTK